MANEKPNHSDKLSSYGLDEIRYWIYASHEKFNMAKFRAAVGATEEKYCHAVFMPKDSSLGYGLRLSVWDEEDEVTIQATYFTSFPDKKKLLPHQQQTSAEEFGTWISRFFKYATSHAHMHGHFSFPLASRVSKFPLPLKTSIEDAEIDGISLSLPSNPEGVGRVRITQGTEEWYVELIADRRMTFNGFTPFQDVTAMADVVNKFLGELK